MSNPADTIREEIEKDRMRLALAQGGPWLVPEGWQHMGVLARRAWLANAIRLQLDNLADPYSKTCTEDVLSLVLDDRRDY